MNFHRIYLRVDADDVMAQRCYEKCGFVREGTLRQAVSKGGRWHDQHLLSVLADEFHLLAPRALSRECRSSASLLNLRFLRSQERACYSGSAAAAPVRQGLSRPLPIRWRIRLTLPHGGARLPGGQRVRGAAMIRLPGAPLI